MPFNSYRQSIRVKQAKFNRQRIAVNFRFLKKYFKLFLLLSIILVNRY